VNAIFQQDGESVDVEEGRCKPRAPKTVERTTTEQNQGDQQDEEVVADVEPGVDEIRQETEPAKQLETYPTNMSEAKKTASVGMSQVYRDRKQAVCEEVKTVAKRKTLPKHERQRLRALEQTPITKLMLGAFGPTSHPTYHDIVIRIILKTINDRIPLIRASYFVGGLPDSFASTSHQQLRVSLALRGS